MTISPIKTPLPDPGFPWVTENGSPSEPFARHMQALAKLVVLLNSNTIGPLTNAANDAAAAAAGVPIGGLYRTVNAVQIRLV